jgi:hypothetical protein
MMTAEEMIAAANQKCLDLKQKRDDTAFWNGGGSVEGRAASARWEGACEVLVAIQRLVR